MGGSNETILPSDDDLRMHESGGEVHIHDDAKGLKFSMPVGSFKSEYKSVKSVLAAPNTNIFEDKITDGCGVRLVAVRDGDEVSWNLESDPTPVDGFDEMDAFLKNY